MEMQKKIFDLPEWAFLESTSHLGNTLEGRTILQHIRSYTMMEIFDLDVVIPVLNKNTKSKEFTYKNTLETIEKHLIAVHFSLAEYGALDDILAKAIEFYSDYMKWEDSNIITDTTAQLN
jgi:hypothetical protein